MISYIENPKKFTKTALVLINEFSKVARYKLIEKNQCFYIPTGNNEIKKMIPLTMASK